MILDCSDSSLGFPVDGGGVLDGVSIGKNQTVLLRKESSRLHLLSHVQSGEFFVEFLLQSPHPRLLLRGPVGHRVVADGEGVSRVGVDFGKNGVLLGEEGSSEVELLDGSVVFAVLGEVVHEFDVVLGDSGGHTSESESDEGLHVMFYLFNYY